MKSLEHSKSAAGSRANAVQRISQPTKAIVDNRPQTIVQRKLQQAVSSRHTQVTKTQSAVFQRYTKRNSSIIQRVVYPTMAAMWSAVDPGLSEATVMRVISKDANLKKGYKDVKAKLSQMNFVQAAHKQPEADSSPRQVNNIDIYDINYDLRTNQQTIDGKPTPYRHQDRFIGAVLHEMMHICAALKYNTNVAPGQATGHFANMHLPVGHGARDNEGYTPNQLNDPQQGVGTQVTTIAANWDSLLQIAQQDFDDGNISKAQADFIDSRRDYVIGSADMHNETVLMDVLYYLIHEGLKGTQTHKYASRMMKEANKRRNQGQGTVARIDPVETGCCTIL